MLTLWSVDIRRRTRLITVTASQFPEVPEGTRISLHRWNDTVRLYDLRTWEVPDHEFAAHELKVEPLGGGDWRMTRGDRPLFDLKEDPPEPVRPVRPSGPIRRTLKFMARPLINWLFPPDTNPPEIEGDLGDFLTA